MGERTVDLELYFLRETDAAVLVSRDDLGEVSAWLPKSLIEYEEHGDIIWVTMPLWLAKREDLL